MTTRHSKSLSTVMAVLLVSTATIALLSPANAMSMGGFGHSSHGSGHGIGSFGHSTGGFNSIRTGATHIGGAHATSLHTATHATHSSISKLRTESKKAIARHGDRPVGGGMYEKAGTGTTANGDRPVGGGMYEKHGTGSGEKSDRPIDGGERNDGWRVDVVPVPVPLVPFDPGQVSVSYGSTPEVGLVRVDDLPQNIARVQSNCNELQAKVAYLMNKLARQLRVLSALQGAQNVAYSATATGMSTSFASPEDAQYAIDRILSDIADSQQLLARYQADLARCLAAGK